MDATSDNPPLIIVGMHRSGTSMLCRLIQQLGVFMGADCARGTAESIFYRKCNIAMLQRLGATWYQPERAVAQLHDTTTVNELSEHAKRHCQSWQRLAYCGWETAIRHESLSHGTSVWGWKDPRNSLTLPVWMSLHPRARVIHIVRNGVDVANSLIVRNKSLRNGNWPAIRRQLAAQIVPWRRSDFHRDPFANHQQAYDLWVKYLEAVETNRRCVPAAQWLEFRYEDFLKQPANYLGRVVSFLNLECAEEKIDAVGSAVRNDRRFALLQDPLLRDFYQHVAGDRIMQLHGYDQLAVEDLEVRSAQGTNAA